jgi:hypothetical protein
VLQLQISGAPQRIGRWKSKSVSLCIAWQADCPCLPSGCTGGAAWQWRTWILLEGLSGDWFEELKFNEQCSTFVLFDKKFSMLD